MGVTWGALPQWAALNFSGSGSGDGYGYSSGYGYGYGYGSGSGDGYGDVSWKLLADCALNDDKAISSDLSVFLAFWRSNKNGSAANGGSMREPARPGLVQRITGPLKLCGPGALHATLDPSKWNGERLWIVALRGEVAIDGDKVGALEREIICEVPLP